MGDNLAISRRIPGRVSSSDVCSYGRVRLYPGGYAEVMAASRPIFRAAGWELVEDAVQPRRRDGGEVDRGAVGRAVRRARARVRDIALSNNLDWFVTLTLDGTRIDRHDDAAAVRRMGQWADNQVRRRGLRYVLVPERHKDGAVHWHGLVGWGPGGPPDGVLADSGTVVLSGGGRPRKPRTAAQRAVWLDGGGQVVYNLTPWRLGFSTAMAVRGDYLAAVGYVCKYIGKGMGTAQGGRVGGRWYYSGGQLQGPEVLLVDMSVEDVEALGGYGYEVEDAGLRMAVWRGRVEDYKRELTL